MSEALTHFRQTLNEINAVSPTFCVAKWKQVTIHLQNGLTHSCHHPVSHPIPQEGLAANPSLLHNTPFKKLQRKLMLDGKRPPECDYCWRVEDRSPDALSDRALKSAQPWARPHIRDIAISPWNANPWPSYVEVSFSHICNLACSYCSPQVSSRWAEEIKKHGAYPTSSKYNSLEPLAKAHRLPISSGDQNPFVEAWWKWWPELYPYLQVFRITGGEPLLCSETYRALDWIIQNPRKDLSVGINSNLSVRPDVFRTFVGYTSRLSQAVKDVIIFTSMESVDRQAEYIRHGLRFDAWLENICTILSSVPQATVVVMCTYNILSLPGFEVLLRHLARIKTSRSLVNNDRLMPLRVDIPCLLYPPHQAVHIATSDLLDYIDRQIEFMNSSPAFSEYERHMLTRVASAMRSEQGDASQALLVTPRRDFYQFIREHDRRRGTSFDDTFPELRAFLEFCRTQ